MKSKKTKLSLVVLGTSVIGATLIGGLVASQPEVVQKEQVTTANPQIEPTEALNGVTHTESSTNLGSPSLETPISEAIEGVGLPIATLPEPFDSLNELEDVHTEDGLWGFKFVLDLPHEVVGEFVDSNTDRFVIKSLKILNTVVDKHGWEIALFKKEANWYLDLVKGNKATEFLISGHYDRELRLQLRDDFDPNAGDPADEVVPVETVKPALGLTWREMFGASGLLAHSEHPKFTYPPKRIELVNYQAPVIEVPSQNLGIVARADFASHLNTEPPAEPKPTIEPTETINEVIERVTNPGIYNSLSSKYFGNFFSDEEITEEEGDKLPEAFESLNAYEIDFTEDYYSFKFDANGLIYDVLGYLAPGGSSKMVVTNLNISGRDIQRKGTTFTLYKRVDTWGFNLTPKPNKYGVSNLEEIFHEVGKHWVYWVNLNTVTWLGDDSTTWNFDETDELTDRDFKDHKINLQNKIKYPHGCYTLPIEGETKYYLEHPEDVTKYRAFIYNSEGVAVYLNPLTGEELSADDIGKAEFTEGSHGKMYKIAKLHKSQTQNV